MDTTLFTRLEFYDGPSKDNKQGNSDEALSKKHCDSLFIRCAGTMEMKFRIPSFLEKFLFSSDEAKKARAENKMSSVITMQIEKDTEQNVKNWETNFLSWIKDNHRK